MALAYIDDDVFSDIADAIRSKNGSNNVYKPGQMAAAIGNLPVVPSSYTYGNAYIEVPASSSTPTLSANGVLND